MIKEADYGRRQRRLEIVIAGKARAVGMLSEADQCWRAVVPDAAARLKAVGWSSVKIAVVQKSKRQSIYGSCYDACCRGKRAMRRSRGGDQEGVTMPRVQKRPCWLYAVGGMALVKKADRVVSDVGDDGGDGR